MSLILALDVGFEATGAAVFDVLPGGEGTLVQVACFRPKKNPNKKHLHVADVDMERILAISRGLYDLIDTMDLKRVVAEIPSGGAKSARAVRCMALASGMIGAIVEGRKLAVEWYSQNDTRRAGLGEEAYMMDILAKKADASMDATARKALKKERDKAKVGIKKRIMERMRDKYPDLKAVWEVVADMEHIADACSTFEAAKSGNLVRMA